MARLSMVQLQQALLTSFPDNSTGLITPEVLRDYFNKVIEAIRPAYGLNTLSTPNTQTLGTTDTPLVFLLGYVSDVPDFTTDAATGVITRLEAGTTRFSINVEVETANGREITATLYRNGVATSWVSSCVGLGAGKATGFSINGLLYEGASAIYQLQVKADTAGTSVTFNHGDMLLETVPVNAY